MLHLLQEHEYPVGVVELQEILQIRIVPNKLDLLTELISMFLRVFELFSLLFAASGDFQIFQKLITFFKVFTFMFILLHQLRKLLLGFQSTHISWTRASDAKEGHYFFIGDVQEVFEPIDLYFFAFLILCSLIQFLKLISDLFLVFLWILVVFSACLLSICQSGFSIFLWFVM